MILYYTDITLLHILSVKTWGVHLLVPRCEIHEWVTNAACKGALRVCKSRDTTFTRDKFDSVSPYYKSKLLYYILTKH